MMLVGFLKEYAVMVVSAVLGTFGYCLVFHIKENKLVYGCIGGAVSITVCFVCAEAGLPLLVQNMISAVGATLYAELMARFVKAPATVFLMPAVIPLVPGGKLYYTMRAIVDRDGDNAGVMARQTAAIALGIAIGIVLVSLVFYQFSRNHVRFGGRFDGVDGPGTVQASQEEEETK